MNKWILISTAAILVLAGGYVFYKSSKNQMSPATVTMDTSSPSSTPMESTSSSTTGTVKEFTVTGSNFKFDPTMITVNKGDMVKINFKSDGGMHDFVLTDFNVKTNVISAGQTETVQFTADKAGTFEYYCSVGNHRAMGMVGKLVVQ